MNKELSNTIEQNEEIGTIQEIVKRVIEKNPEYSADLLELIPEELLNTNATDENLQEVADKLDIISSKKEKEYRFLSTVARTIVHQ